MVYLGKIFTILILILAGTTLFAVAHNHFKLPKELYRKSEQNYISLPGYHDNLTNGSKPKHTITNGTQPRHTIQKNRSRRTLSTYPHKE